MLSRLARERQRVVDAGQHAFLAYIAFELGEPSLEERQVQLVSLVGEGRHALPHLSHAGLAIAQPSSSPATNHSSIRQILREPIFLAERDKGFSSRQQCFGVAAKSFKESP